MPILIILLFLGVLSFYIPRKNLKSYFKLSAVILSSLFFFYEPPISDDLYRYYGLFDIIKKLSLKELIQRQFNSSDWLYDYLINDYLSNSKTFMAGMFILSRIGIKQLLPFVFTLLTYIPLFMLIIEVGEDTKASKIAMCIAFVLVLACVDYRLVSIIRNISAYAMFSKVLYDDLVRKKNRIICFVFYLILCELHMACIVLLGIRLVILLTNKRCKYIMIAMFVSLFALTEQIIWVLRNYFSNFGFLLRLAQRIGNYNIGRTSYNIHGALFFVGSIIVTLIIYANYKRAEGSAPLEEYRMCYLYITAYTIGSIKQYDVLTRNTKLLVMLVIPFAVYLITKTIRIRGVKLIFMGNGGGISTTSLIHFLSIELLIIVSFVFYTLFSYIPMWQWFVF